MCGVQRRKPRPSIPHPAVALRFLSATRSIRNQTYLAENTPHPKTLSATKSARFTPRFSPCAKKATLYPRNCVTRGPGSPTGPVLACWGGRYTSRPGLTVSHTKQRQLKFLPGTLSPFFAIPFRAAPKAYLLGRPNSTRFAMLAASAIILRLFTN
jgi:hypothetical protein